MKPPASIIKKTYPPGTHTKIPRGVVLRWGYSPGMAIQQVCLDCGSLNANGQRCTRCATRREQLRYKARSHYHGDYKRRAKHVRETAEQCWLCGEGARPDDPWTADHVVPGDPGSLLLPAHRSCNSRRGDGAGRRAETVRRIERRRR